jgi:hypothetical protein
MWCMGWRCKQRNVIFVWHNDCWDWQLGHMFIQNQANRIFLARHFAFDKMLQSGKNEPLIWPTCGVCNSNWNCKSNSQHVLEINPRIYQHLTNMATNRIYINNQCDIPHTSHLFDSLSTCNFRRNLNRGIVSLFFVTDIISCDIVSWYKFLKYFKKCCHIFTIKSRKSSDTISFTCPHTHTRTTDISSVPRVTYYQHICSLSNCQA